ncbi:helix-turn-helix domain-containing protein [Endozoicomonas atrinae]|uniref:helix-turn-helix domain-containing protein n=1 Tax=Endozoicomonas atrinae TaxID=1333660 RepID=UPI000827101C|nr:helix-turn-helix transcriptional regulator [Endozoicomonas atrinae]
MITWQERVRILLANRNMTQTELANKLGVTKATVSVWLREDACLTLKNILKLQRRMAPFLEVTPEYIMNGDETESAPGSSIPNEGRSVPHLSTADISQWHLTRKVSNPDARIHCPIDCGEHAFSFTLSNTSMENEGLGQAGFPYDSLIFVDPDLPLEFNKLCLFYDKAPIVGSYQEYNGKTLLVCANPKFEAVHVVRDNFIGRVVGCFFETS